MCPASRREPRSSSNQSLCPKGPSASLSPVFLCDSRCSYQWETRRMGAACWVSLAKIVCQTSTSRTDPLLRLWTSASAKWSPLVSPFLPSLLTLAHLDIISCLIRFGLVSQMCSKRCWTPTRRAGPSQTRIPRRRKPRSDYGGEEIARQRTKVERRSWKRRWGGGEDIADEPASFFSRREDFPRSLAAPLEKICAPRIL